MCRIRMYFFIICCLLTPIISSYAIQISDSISVGGIDWYQKTELDYGVRFFLPLEMEIQQGEGIEQGTATATLLGTTEDGAVLVMRAAKEKLTLDELEILAAEEMEIDPEENEFELLGKGTANRLNYRWYNTVGLNEGKPYVFWVTVANHTNRDFSYIFYLGVPGDVWKDYQSAFLFWFTNLYGLKERGLGSQ